MDVYRNLHNGKLSLRDEVVVGHADKVILSNVTFKVNKAGVDRIRETKRKEVCATVSGKVRSVTGFEPYKDRTVERESEFEPSIVTMNAIFFNPYKHDGFVDARGVEVKAARTVCVSKDGYISASGVEYA